MTEKITSTTNQKVKKLIKLKDKKYRDQYSLFCVENFKIIKDAAAAGFIPEEIFVSEIFFSKHKADFNRFVAENNIKEFFIISEKVSEKISNLETPPGVCAVYGKIKAESRFDEPIVYLNEISDPGNLGTILRTALAFGFKNIVIDEKCADLFNFKTINAAKDAIFKLNINSGADGGYLKKIKKEMPIYATRMDNAVDINEFIPDKKYCVVFGNESRGVDGAVQKMSDKFIKINIKNIESLNVAAAASIILHKLGFYLD